MGVVAKVLTTCCPMIFECEAVKLAYPRAAGDAGSWHLSAVKPPTIIRLSLQPERWRLDASMSGEEIARELERMVFTAARGWTRAVRIDREVRDMLVRALRLAHG
jgi:hypothetical protein